MPELSNPQPETAPARRISSALPYCLGFVAVQLALLGAALAMSSTQWFTTHNGYDGMLQTGYSLRLQHEDCDVVIYGDSSTTTGLDPAIVQQVTGLKTCNISEGSTILSVIGNHYPLDQYLSHNKRPRFLLAMYTSSIFLTDRPAFDAYTPEGMMFTLQHLRGRALYQGLLTHPLWDMKLAILAGRSVLMRSLDYYVMRNTASVDTRAQRDSRRGIWPYPDPPETHCSRAPINPQEVERHPEQVASLRQRYGVGGTQVIVNISPVPDCDPFYDLYRERTEGLHDNELERLPISYFNQGDVHFSAEGSRYLSLKAANQILALERQQSVQSAAPGGPTQ